MALKVVMTIDFGDTTHGEELLKRIGADFIKIQCNTEEDVIAAARDADAAISGGVEPFTKKVIDNLSKCRIISNMAIGFDNIDVNVAIEKGILVSNVPGFCLDEVSDHALALLLACYRKIFPLGKLGRSPGWEYGGVLATLSPLHRLRGQTLGIVGFGRIGRTLTPKAQALGLEVITYSPHVAPNVARKAGVKMVELDRLLRESDFVSVHTALTSENRHMFGLQQFMKMKPTAYLINVARGGLVDEQALYTALCEGYIAGAAIDVMDPEPPASDNPLLGLDNVIITPHAAYYSEEALEDVLRQPFEEVVRVFQGEWPCVLLNPEAKEKFTKRWGKPA